jgi:diguanylate cyclase (GGDEF)-like protein
MPEVTGFDILEAVRVHPKYKHLPIIILTASSDTENKLLALELGATDFLTKPVDPSELSLRIRNTLAAKAFMDQLAYYDRLTSLPNRRMFMEHLEWALKAAKRNQEHLAILSIELDQFDRISDSLGLFAGDELLSDIARRMQKVVRSVDLFGNTNGKEVSDIKLSRFEGSVFSLLLYRLNSEENAAKVADRLLTSIREPLTIENKEIYVTASIGIATYPSENDDCIALLRQASSARDHVKSQGGDSFQFSTREINIQYERRLSLEARLRKAIKRDELLLHYQPKVDIRTGDIKGVEALLRWHHPDKGIIPPNRFIPLAEETGLIIPIGEWIFNTAIEHLTQWHKSGKIPIGMAINLSSIQFQNHMMPAFFERIIDRCGIDPQLLTLELTESILMDDIENNIEMMKRLKDRGLILSIDDFGTGYSSLSYLRRLPIDELKIDRSFIVNVFHDKKSRAIVSSVIFLSHSLGKLTVAEGIETEEQLHILKKEGCDQYQGYLFSPPLSSTDLFNLLPAK